MWCHNTTLFLIWRHLIETFKVEMSPMIHQAEGAYSQARQLEPDFQAQSK